MVNLNSLCDSNSEGDSPPDDPRDVKKSVVNGIPLIEFSKRIHQLLVNEMSISVVFKLLGRNIGFVALQNKLYGIGRPSKHFQLMDIENGYFLAKFQSLPNYLYKKEVLWDIGGMVGKVTKLDFNTNSKARGWYARMAVYANLDKPLVLKAIINGNIQRIEYESLPVVCFSYGNYGHNKDYCPHSLKTSASWRSGFVTIQENTAARKGEFDP
ncbi:hypothetical protein Gohar_004288 [Gossypium harknessii]|uniref:DUF4283 domain-containing protein n=1 Tax=Gossypium harknessii TaxID=34285 RepID=A0A7J9H4I2_9ROSI|nr:hypothetical protein [Gossypium harknessii]